MTDDDMMEVVQRYRQLVLDYEALDEEIDTFIQSRGGKDSHDMTPEDLAHYKALALRREEMLNEMRILEAQLNLNDEDAP